MLREKGISVRQALSMEVLKGARVLAGGLGLDRIITGVSVMEAPDITDKAKEGELLLTAADDINALRYLVPAMNEKGLSGIGVKTKRYISTVPEEIVNMGNKLDFPIIELPYGISFSDVASTVLTEIFNKQAGVLTNMESMHQKLMKVVLSGGGIKKVTEELAGIIENTIVIKDYIFGKVFAVSHQGGTILSESAIKNIIGGKNCYADETAGSGSAYRIFESRAGEQSYRRWVFPIITEQGILGEIQVMETNKQVNPMDIRAIEYSGAVIAFELMKQISVFEVEDRNKYEFLEELLSPEPGIHAAAAEQARMRGFETGNEYMIAILGMKEMSSYIGGASIEKGAQYKNRLLQTIEGVVKKSGSKAFIGCKKDTVTVLIAFNSQADQAKGVKEQGTGIISNISRLLAAGFENEAFYAGIGRCYPKLEELWKSNGEAERALSFCKLFRNESIVHYDDLGIFRLICMEHREDEIRKFCQETVMPLVNYDKTKNGELVKTLQAYFDCEGNLKKVCKKMFIHYNTILYRIQKIQKITGMDLRNANSRLNLEVSLKVMSLINCKDSGQAVHKL